MKKLYRRGTVHPSPPTTTDHLSSLPATFLTLAAALSAQDREVLAYLISCSTHDFGNFSSHRKNSHDGHPTKRSMISSGHDHPPLFTCDCFRCYMSYWARWDSSPNRQLIHEIIDAFEDGLAQISQSNKKKSKKDRKKKKAGGCGAADGPGGTLKRPDLKSLRKDDSSDQSKSVEESSRTSSGGEVYRDDGCEEETEKDSSVRRFVNLVGQRIWNVWGQ